MKQAQPIIPESIQPASGVIFEKPVDLSVVVAISERLDDLRDLYNQYSEQISANGYSYEFIFVLDGPEPQILQTLKELRQGRAELNVVILNRQVG